MKNIPYFFIFVYSFSLAEAQQDSARIHTESKVLNVASDMVLIIPSSVLFVITHEFGHYVVASILGAQNVRVGLRIYSISGWTAWSNDIGRFGIATASLSGCLFSRGLAEGSDYIIRHTDLPQWNQRFFAMTYLWGRIDFPMYLLKDVLYNLSGKGGSDIDIFVTQIAGQNGSSRSLTYAALFAIATLDFVLDWDRIVMHWNFLAGKPYSNFDTHAQLCIYPYFTHKSIGLSARVIW